MYTRKYKLYIIDRLEIRSITDKFQLSIKISLGKYFVDPKI